MKPRDPLALLAAVVRKINAAAHDRAELPALLDELAGSGLFSTASLFGARAHVFVFVDTRGVDMPTARQWLRWPLRRLFASMLPRRIVHPERTESALAIPFDYGSDRSVVLATLGPGAHAPEFEAFFEALEHFTIHRMAMELTIPEYIPLSPIDPQVVAFGLCPALHETIQTMFARRAWPLRVFEHYAELRMDLAASRPDVLLFDAGHLTVPMGMIVRLHSALPEGTRLVTFGSGLPIDLERQALTDALLDHEAPEVEIFSMLKRFARQVPELRRTRLREVTSGAELALKASRTPQELTLAGARQAAEIMSSGWASLHLVNESGTIYAAEHPREGVPIFTSLPKAYLSDVPLFQIRADQRFFEEISDDRRVVGALSRLHPVSAASIPLRHGNGRFGALISISRDVPADSVAFEALDGFARVVTGRFEEFTRAAAMMQTFERRGVWEYVRHGSLEFAVYRSRNSSVAWDYRAVRPDRAMLCVGDAIESAALGEFGAADRALESELAESLATRPNKRSFVAACDPIAATFTYAAAGFPAPLVFDARGPAGAIHSRGSIVSGTVAIAPPAGLLVWDHPLRQWLMRENVDADAITEVLEDLRPPGLAIVVTRIGA